jgi:hypothetical protein
LIPADQVPPLTPLIKGKNCAVSFGAQARFLSLDFVYRALLASALSASAAIFLILELDQPFHRVIQIPSDPMINALSQLKESSQ